MAIAVCLLWAIFILLLKWTSSEYLSGFITGFEEQKEHLLGHINLCLIKSYRLSRIKMNKQILQCINAQLQHCIAKNYSSLSHYPRETNSPRITYCGALWVNDNLGLRTLYIYKRNILVEVPKDNMIHFSVFKFNFQLSKICWQHSMSLIYRAGKNDIYCGSRLPWKLIITKSKVKLKLTIAKYKVYAFGIFYSAAQHKSLGNLSKIFEKYTGRGIMSITTLPTLIPFSIKDFVYHIETNIFHYIVLDIFPVNSSTLTIHDGPGPLSNTIYDSDLDHVHRNQRVRSSAFIIYLRITLLDVSTAHNNRLDYKNKRQNMDCEPLQSYTKTSSESKNTFYLGCIYFGEYIVHMRVDAFTYSGQANTLTVSWHWPCQYGGLWTNIFEQTSVKFGICETVYDLDLYAESTLPVVFAVVWFSGYSNGRIKITSYITNCKTYYAETSKSVKLVDATILMHSGSFGGCGVFICSPAANHSETTCAIQLGPPDLGPTDIHVELRKTSSVCDNPYTKYENPLSFSMYTSSSNIWPFSTFKNISYQKYSINDTKIKSFDYLHNSTILLPQICKMNERRSQLAVIVETSSCYYQETNNVQDDWLKVVSNTPILSGKCLRKNVKFMPNTRNTLVKHAYDNFIFLDNGNIQYKHSVRVDYTRCPQECRTYKYRTFTRSHDYQTIVEYTADVGNFTYTEDRHRGFKVSISALNTSCRCEFNIIVRRSKLFKSTYDDDISNISTLRFYKKR